MDNFIRRLPTRPQPLIVRAVVTTAVMAACIATQLIVASTAGLPGLFILLVGIFVAALLFDRGSGFYATLLATISAYAVLPRLYPQSPIAIGLVIFFAVGIAVSMVSEALRLALERAVNAEREKDILFRELSHRMQNNLAIASSLLQMQSRNHPNAEVAAALASAVSRLGILADGQKHLQPKGDGLVEMRDYLGEVCEHLMRSVETARAIEFALDVQPVTVSADKALVLGLITNELVTNAIKYAFDDDQKGTITVSLWRGDTGAVELAVADDGNGCPDGAADGFGTSLIKSLVARHNGSSVRQNMSPGCRVHVQVP